MPPGRAARLENGVFVRSDWIQDEASTDAYITDYAEAAVVALEDEGVDVKGADYQPEEVEVTPGGE